MATACLFQGQWLVIWGWCQFLRLLWTPFRCLQCEPEQLCTNLRVPDECGP